MSYGRRYSLAEKREILRYRETHTYEETSQKFGVSQMTLARWSKRISRWSNRDMTNTPTTPKPIVELPYGVRLDLWSLLQVLKSIDGVNVISLVSDEGKSIASLGTETVNEGKLLAMTAALLSLGERSSREFEQGNLEMMLTKANGGTTLVVGAGEHAVLVMLFDASADLSKLFARDFPLIDKIREVVKTLY
ncbi:MAG: hypothetical protein RBG13Loki_2883 [Promethearchaeota archaeon CR_4]|nr:MAG: hypothetical protein RBG13Loki_2883 [Candidatus Lokiarchaeota archaeon CR_4]